MKKHLYDIFKNWYCEGSIYLYSDPHFSSELSYRFRFPKEFDMDNLDGISEETKQTAINGLIQHLDEMQIKNINKKCGKKDCLIILGDVGNIECVKKLKARYKILILGNHDHNTGYYKKKEIQTDSDKDCQENNLFDEVYNGTLQISPKIILSHEPVDYKYCLNIHGHIHSINPLGSYTEKLDENSQPCGGWYNCCAEQINYIPVNLNSLIDSGLLKNVPDIHRQTIDKAIERGEKEENK